MILTYKKDIPGHDTVISVMYQTYLEDEQGQTEIKDAQIILLPVSAGDSHIWTTEDRFHVNACQSAAQVLQF